VTNPVRDLYDQAFVLLALASATAVAAAPPLRRAALELVAWMDRAMTHEAGGYREAEPPLAGAPRRQNPHMHLLEAMLAAHEAFGDPVFLHHASALVGLFLDRMFDAVTGTLPEFFDEAWHPVPHPGGYLIEPGHHCEWVWLLDWHARLTGPNQATEVASAALMRFVDRFGHAPAGGMADIVTSQGEMVAGATRLWGQAERLKAELIRKDGTAARQLAAAGILAGFLHEDGGFHDRKDAAGRMIAAPAPASSLYHLTSAILTAERCVLTHATHARTSGA
jgi:mannose/cellobiose epimerase-like protein (N-acyl-D-glucosamine 2-epimerase family)